MLDIATLLDLLIKCAILFVCGSALFDIVHYLLHVFEKSPYRLLRWLGGFHSVHHEFLDRDLQIQRKFSRANLILHVIPEYLTAVIGVAALGFLYFGWLPAAIVIGIRTVMVIVYIAQKGEDFTHASLDRINAQRSLLFVGPNYHALHHVYPYQYYSSFINIFDLIFGTNLQVKERSFLFLGTQDSLSSDLQRKLLALGGEITVLSNLEISNPKDQTNLKATMAQTDVLIYADDDSQPVRNFEMIIDTYKELGLRRLVPPEVWYIDRRSRATRISLESKAKSYFKDKDLIFKRLSGRKGLPVILPNQGEAQLVLFLLRRGFRIVPLRKRTTF